MEAAVLLAGIADGEQGTLSGTLIVNYVRIAILYRVLKMDTPTTDTLGLFLIVKSAWINVRKKKKE